jgi:NAD(P)-dependent dehydrogenase (short-subunit alcohol dehydrogenase family)
VTDELFNVRGKVALVTGGTSGIGHMIASGLVQRGCKTYITGRDLAKTQAVASQLSAAVIGAVGSRTNADALCFGLAADLADPEGPQKLAEELARHEPLLNILVNNAGASEPGTLEALSIESWDKVLDVNVRSVFFLIQSLLPLLRAGASPQDPSRIINIGSIGGLHIPNWDAFPYGASKAAIHHMTRALAKRLGKDHITANAIAPGPFPSRMTNTSSDAVKKSVQTYIPLGRAGEPTDVQGLVVFLASRAGAYVNGSTIPLDGGYIAAL